MHEIIKRGIAEGLIRFDEEQKYITYIQQNKRRSFKNPEEKVQAEAFCRLVLHYKYPVEHIQQFVTVKMGASSKEADIVVYKDKAHTKPYIVVECKQENASQAEFEEAEKQAAAYAYALAGTTKFTWITKSNQEAFYKIDKESEKREIQNNIPFYGEDEARKYNYAKKGYYWKLKDGKKVKEIVSDLEPISEAKLTTRFKQAHDALWAGGELNENQAFDEFDKLIFCKIWDERTTKNGEPYKFQIYNGEDLADLKSRILGIYEKGKIKDPNIFNKPIDLSAERIKTIVDFFQEVHLGKTDLDSKGKAFETFIGSYFRGNFGQYFTPRNVVKFIVDSLPIHHESRVLDTSCGSGGFLLYALDKVRRQADELYPEYAKDVEDYADWKRHWHDFAEKNLYGIEINDQISRVAKMNMIIHDDGHTNVVTVDGLYRIAPEPRPKQGETEDARRAREARNQYTIQTLTGNKGFKENSFDFIITNPPFGSIVRQSEKSYMRIAGNTAPYYNFALKNVNWIDQKLKKNHRAASRPTQSTEVLFIEQCYKFLRPHGYIAVVIPDGVLTNSSLQYVRDEIEELFRIVAVVSLPQTTFTHTGAGVKSSVLVLRKHDLATTRRIKQLKGKLQEQTAEEQALISTVDTWLEEKKELLKPLKAKDEATKAKRSEISGEYRERINDFKEEIATQYTEAKQTALPDYPIFMAIAKHIGYDATGKPIAENDLDAITAELRRFITAIENDTDEDF